MSEIMWNEVHALVNPRGCGVFFLLLSTSRGRSEFWMEPDDIAALMSDMCRPELDDVAEQLADAGLVRRRVLSDGSSWWAILRRPPEWAHVN